MTTKSVVFTRYHEDGNAILSAYRDLPFDWKVYVYDRGVDKLILPKPNRLAHIIDSNKGREDGGYLKHIIDNYYKFKDKDIIVFSQARYNDMPYQHKGKFSEWIGNLGVEKYNSYISTVMRTFLYCDAPGNNHISMPDVWKIAFPSNPVPKFIDFHPCAIFATSGEAIRKRSIIFYKKFYELTSDPINCKIIPIIKNKPSISRSFAARKRGYKKAFSTQEQETLRDNGLEIPWCLERYWETIFSSNK